MDTHDGLFFSHVKWNLNLKSDLATKVDFFYLFNQWLTVTFEQITMFIGSWNGCKLSLHLKNRRKHDLMTFFFLPEDKNKTQLSLSHRAREVAGDIS